MKKKIIGIALLAMMVMPIGMNIKTIAKEINQTKVEEKTEDTKKDTTNITKEDKDSKDKKNSKEIEANAEKKKVSEWFPDITLANHIRSQIGDMHNTDMGEYTKEELREKVGDSFGLIRKDDESEIKDLTGMEILTELKSLNIHGSDYGDKITLAENCDLAPIKDLTNLEELNLSENYIKDISALKGLTKLEKLELNDNQIDNLTPLKDLTNLTELDLSSQHKNDGKTFVLEDITPLKKLTNLKDLKIWGNNIKDITGLAKLTKLEMLDINQNYIEDITPLKNLVNLKELEGWSNVWNDDLTALQNMKKLEHLDLGGYHNSKKHNDIKDLTPLKNLTNLVDLDLSYGKIEDITPLKNLTNLYVLELNYNQIEDITLLKNLKNLNFIYLNGNRILDFTALDFADDDDIDGSGENGEVEATVKNGVVTLKNPVKFKNYKIKATNISNKGKYNSKNNTIEWKNAKVGDTYTFKFNKKLNNIDDFILALDGKVTVKVVKEENSNNQGNNSSQKGKNKELPETGDETNIIAIIGFIIIGGLVIKIRRNILK